MLTRDPILSHWFKIGAADNRVYGFLCGYRATYGKGKDHLPHPDYKQGWEEGKSLRFDEMVAAQKFKLHR